MAIFCSPTWSQRLIHVERTAEPTTFDSSVRQPRKKFLARFPKPSKEQWRHHDYWVRCLPDLHSAYRGICAYSCHWIPFDTGFKTVEHFESCTKNPSFAYEWHNYR